MKALHAASSPAVTVCCLLALCVLVFWGTLYQASAGLHAAQARFFRAWFVTAFGAVPFPGVTLVTAALACNLLLAIPLRVGFAWRRLGLLLIHAGIALLLLGGALARALSSEGQVALYEGQSAAEALDSSGTARLALPVTIRLVDFVKHDYPGTALARDYESRLRVTGPGIDCEVRVSMNRPFRCGSYTFYQYSFSQDSPVESATLAVVKNPARHVPYAAALLIAAGLLLHMAMRLAAALRVRRGGAA